MISFNNFLYSGFIFNDEDYEVSSRYILINSVLGIGCVLVFGLISLHFLNGEIFSSTTNSVLLTLLLYLIYLLRQTKAAYKLVAPFLVIWNDPYNLDTF